MKKTVNFILAFVFSLAFLTVPRASAQTEEIDIILDWVPNTNHTGLFVALENGYFEDEGLSVNVIRPPQGSAAELVGLGEAEFGIDFQDYLAQPLEGGLPVTAVAAIIENNTSGILSQADDNIETPADIEGKRYGTSNNPIDIAILEHLLTQAGASSDNVELVPNQGDNSIVALANDQFDAVQVYYAWDGLLAETQGVETNFMPYIDFAPELNFYSPVIIANNDYLAENPDQASQVLKAIKRGYQFAIENPSEAADILIKHAPELEGQAEFVHSSQEWVSGQYASNPDKWGYIDEERWNTFYQWLYENGLTETDLSTGDHFSNEYLGE